MNIDDDFKEKTNALKNQIISKNQSDSKINPVALLIILVPVLPLILFIIGASMSKHQRSSDFFVFLEWFIGVIVFWVILMGFAEIIQILHDIRRNQKK